MRPTLFALVFLATACYPLATPAPYAAPASVDAQQMRDAGATAVVAAAAYEYAVLQTQQAGTQQAQQTQQSVTATVQHQQQAATLMAAEAYATQQSVASAATMAAISVTVQSGVYVAETATIAAARATETATAAIPAMTATRAAEVVSDGREADTWFMGWALGALAFLVAIAAGYNVAVSFGAEREARARGEEADARGREAEAQARAFAIQLEAQRAATLIQIAGGRMFVIVSGAITEERLLEPGPVTPPTIIEQPPARPPDAPPQYQDAIAFLGDAIVLRKELNAKSPDDWPPDRLPGAAHFAAAGVARWGNGSTWQRMVDNLNGAFVGTPRGTFANKERGYRSVRDVYHGVLRAAADAVHAAHSPTAPPP